MRISWLGHATFLLETKNGTTLITDPYEAGGYGGAIGYKSINIKPDIVTVSHEHADHNCTKEFTRSKIINQAGIFKVEDTEIEGVPSYHDKEKGAARGKNIIFIIKSESLRIVHLGDLGTLDIDHSKFTNTDILLVPIGGTFTIDASEASELIKKINPKISIPMHFKTPKLGFDIDGVDNFLKGKDYEEKDAIEVDPKAINSFKKIIVLKNQR